MSILRTIARGDASRVAEPRRALARTDDEWRSLWAVHAGPGADAPAVDLTKVIVAAAFAGDKPSAGQTIEITAADPADPADPADRADKRAADHADHSGVLLLVEERGPGPGMVAAALVTSPFHIVAVPRTAGEVSWASEAGDWGSGIGDRGSEKNAEAFPIPDPRSPIPDPRSSTGLEPRTASALAYLAGPFSGGLILLAETTNQDVRFHAWQSIVGLGGLGLAVLGAYLLAFVVMFVSATAVSVMLGAAGVIWIVLLIVWAICLWKAWSGERWKLPFAGDYAERFVAR